jgi:carboxylesterase type B
MYAHIVVIVTTRVDTHSRRWGESAGAISISLQMLTNGGNTEGLFRAAFMQSGSPIPVGDITHGQQYYDALVQEVGCSSASDTLACLRTVDYADLHAAMDNSPDIFSYQVYPLVVGSLLRSLMVVLCVI